MGELREHQKQTDRELAAVRSELTNTRAYMHSLGSSLQNALSAPPTPNQYVSSSSRSPPYSAVPPKRTQRITQRDQIFVNVEKLQLEQDSSPAQTDAKALFDPQHVLPVNA